MALDLFCAVCGVSVRAEGRCGNGVCLACHNDYCDMREGHVLNIETARALHAARVAAKFQDTRLRLPPRATE